MPGSSTQVSLRLRTLPYSRLALSLRLGRALHDTPGSRPEVRGLDTHRPGRTRRRRPRTRPADHRTPPSRNRSYGGYCTATLNTLACAGGPIREKTRSHDLSRMMHYLAVRGRAKLSSWPSRSWMWKYRSPQGASAGEVSGSNPAARARRYIASTSSTQNTTRPQMALRGEPTVSS